MLGGHAGSGLDGGDGIAQRMEQAVGPMGGEHLVIEQPVEGLASIVGTVAVVRLVLGVGAQQIVERVPVGTVFDDQVGAGQLAQQ